MMVVGSSTKEGTRYKTFKHRILSSIDWGLGGQGDLDELRNLSKVVSEMVSINEELSEISTSDLLFIVVDYYLAESIFSQQFGSDQAARIVQLRECLMAFDRFFNLAYNLSLLAERVEVDVNTESGVIPKRVSREQKIANYRAEKELSARLTRFHDRLKAGFDIDEEEEREAYMNLIRRSVIKAGDALNTAQMEYSMLQTMSRASVSSSDQAPSNAEGEEQGDLRIDTAIPLLDRKGQVQRPFVITSRKEQVEAVFRPGHRLPTMSIDEYLKEEFERGNVIGPSDKSGGATGVDREDDEMDDEEKTRKQREWDNFKDENPRGWGNTRVNRG